MMRNTGLCKMMKARQKTCQAFSQLWPAHVQVYEILDNSIDEVQAGHATHIQVSARLQLRCAKA